MTKAILELAKNALPLGYSGTIVYSDFPGCWVLRLSHKFRSPVITIRRDGDALVKVRGMEADSAWFEETLVDTRDTKFSLKLRTAIAKVSNAIESRAR
jgi:hypothetical protein